MPGGGGGGQAKPPKMRLRRDGRGGAVVYADASPKSLFWLRARAAVYFVPASFALAVPFLIVGTMILSWAGRKPEWASCLAPLSCVLGTAAAFGVSLLGPARVEWEPSRARQALVFRRVYLWGPPREKEYRKPDVEAVALLERDRRGPYLQMKLVLADGGTVFVEEGEERARMEELAQDVAAATGLPLVRAMGVGLAWPLKGRLTRLALPSGGGRWVDFDYDARLVAAWGLCLGALLLSTILLYNAGRVATEGWTAASPKADPPLPRFLFCAGLGAVCVLAFVAFAGRLSLPRYLGVRLSPREGRVAFLQRTWSGGTCENVVCAGEAGVVLLCDKKGEARRVWLEAKSGWRRYVDGGGKGEELRRLAEDLSQCLRTPLRREVQSLYWR